MKRLRDIMCDTVIKGGSIENEFAAIAFKEGYSQNAIEGFIELFLMDMHNRNTITKRDKPCQTKIILDQSIR